MSSQEQFMASGGAPPPRKLNAQPECPGCNRSMTVRQVSPVLFASGIDDVVYGCARCGAETKRLVRR